MNLQEVTSKDVLKVAKNKYQNSWFIVFKDFCETDLYNKTERKKLKERRNLSNKDVKEMESAWLKIALGEAEIKDPNVLL